MRNLIQITLWILPVLAAVLLLACVLQVLPTAEAATTASGTCGNNLTWTLDDTGTLTISGTGEMESYMYGSPPWKDRRSQIKSLVVQEGVTSVSSNAFQLCTELESAELPDSLTWIGWGAFYSCSKLKQISIPDNVTGIDYTAFAGCTDLAEVYIGTSVASIGRLVFQDCSSLQSITIPKSTSTLYLDAFNGCTALVEIAVDAANQKYSSLDGVLFNKDQSELYLTPVNIAGSYTIPKSVTKILSAAFSGRDLLEAFVVDEDHPRYTTIDGVLFSKDQTVLELYPAGKEGNYTIPDGVTVITDFCANSKLTCVTIPDGIQKVLSPAFTDCSNLKHIVFEGSTFASVEGFPFAGVTATAYYPANAGWDTFTSYGGSISWVCYDLSCISSGTCGDNLTWNLDGLGTLTISGSGKMADYSSSSYTPWYKNRSSIKQVIIEDGVTTIGNEAFQDCSVLTGVTIPNSVTTIGESAFWRSNISSITLPDGVTTIGESAFDYCFNLANITIPDSVSTIGRCAFMNCTDLTSITIPDGITTISEYTFFGCKALTSVAIPDSVTAIGEEAFYNCTGLTSITIGSGVESIGASAFARCSSMTAFTIASDNRCYSADSNGILYNKNKTTLICCPAGKTGALAIPNSVITINDTAFEGCAGLTNVTIPNSVTTIGYQAFYNCTGLTGVTIPNGVTTLGRYAFRGCTGLASITLPNSITTLDYGIFYDCSGLTSVTIPNNVTTLEEQVFLGCSGLTSVSISDSVTKIGDSTFSGCTGLTAFVVGSGNTCFSAGSDGVLYNKNKTTLISYPGKKTGAYTIPDSVSKINAYAFYECTGLTGVTIPNGVTCIDTNTFAHCTGLTSVTIPSSITYLDILAFCGCTNLKKIHFEGNAPSIDSRTFTDVTATAYYPKGNKTWTADVMQNYGGTIAWVAYDVVVEPACALDELTTLDYLAFAQIAYLDFKSDGTVKDCLTAMGYWDLIWNEDQNITYGQLCEHIAQWRVDKSSILNLSYFNGFYAVPFTNGNGEAVLAYRGSVPPEKMFSNGVLSFGDFWCDWIINDLPIELANDLGPQYHAAITIYEAIELKYGKSNMVVTGHSLGGAWGDVVSAYSGCEGVTFNAVSVLDTVYNEKPADMGKEFSGVDSWNFVDHTNKYDILAGMFESYWSLNRIKPYTGHGSIYAATNIGGSHALTGIVERDIWGKIQMTKPDVASSFSPFNVVSNRLSFTSDSVHLGTSRNDTINEGSNFGVKRRIFGGDGDDNLTGGIHADILVGGRGHDTLDGSWSNDSYLYYKGDGWDYIHDVAGADSIHLYGFSDSDTIEAVVSDATIDIKCNGTRIISIFRTNREYSLFSTNRFVVHVGTQEIDITDMFKTRKYASRVKIACPVEVQILDADGNVVYTLEDGVVGNYYTEYGNFYVFEEESGGYGKVLDLVEGYSTKIVGVDDGTMDITYHALENGELADEQTMTDIPVSKTFIGYLVAEEPEGNEEGNAALWLNVIGDMNGDNSVNNDDVLYLLWHTLYEDLYPIKSNSDFTGDNLTTHADVIYLLWHTLFRKSYPLS